MMINCITMNTKARNNDLLLIIKLCQYFVNASDMICKKSNETLLNKQRGKEERTSFAMLNISKDKQRPQEPFFPCQNFARLAPIKLKQGRRGELTRSDIHFHSTLKLVFKQNLTNLLHYSTFFTLYYCFYSCRHYGYSVFNLCLFELPLKLFIKNVLKHVKPNQYLLQQLQ